jgi:polyisoprenyl-phosphate glycosyltransferase
MNVASKPTLSIILPVFNEEEMIEPALRTVMETASGVGVSFEILAVDDGSGDRTAELIAKIASQDPRVVPISFSRNFGKEAALAAGLEHARGDAVVLMDADLQHPPSVIAEMVAKWREGFDVVNAVKEERCRESLLYRLVAGSFNHLMGIALRREFLGASDFKLLDRQVVDSINTCGERVRFFRGLVAWVGFRTASVSFVVAERAAGKAKWSTAALIRYSLKNLFAFSSLPLKCISLMGFVTALFSLGLGLQTLYNYLAGRAVSGFTTVILLQILIGSFVILSIGTVGLYLAQMYHEIKGRPLYIVQKTRVADGQKSSCRDEMPPRH